MIDFDLILNTFSKDFIENITKNKEQSLQCLWDAKHFPLYNKNRYFHNLSNYAKRADEAGFKNILDLYPSNVGVLEYVIKNLDEFKGADWLDFGCGIGMLGVYLDYLGIKFYGYDDFSQGVHKEVAIDFLKKYNLQDRLIEKEEIYSRSWYSISSMGIQNFLDIKRLKTMYFFDDFNYKTNELANMNLTRILTNKLLIIYKTK